MAGKCRIVLLCLAVFAVFLLVGCENERDENQEKYRQYGINCMKNGKYEDAAEAFQKALEQSSGKIGKKEIDICFYKAEAQYLSGAYEEALETYGGLIEYDQSGEAYYLRGNLYFQLGENEKAVNDFGAAVTKDSKDYELYIGIYESMAAHGMEDEGKYYLNEALKIDGNKAYDNMQKGRIYYLLGDTDHAVTLLSKAIEDGNVEANFYLAETYESLGDRAQADAYFQTYLDSGIANSIELCEMGEHQMANGDYEHALTYFSAALAMDEVPNKQTIMRDSIIAYEQSGDFASARKMMDSYLELYPSDEDAQREKTFLETR